MALNVGKIFFAERSVIAYSSLEMCIRDRQEAGRMAQAYGNTVIITMGAAGAAVGDGEKSEQIPSCKVQAVETTGAGDSFIGGVGYAVLALSLIHI